MLYWTGVFLIIALIAAIFGFGNVASTSSEMAKTLFFVFLVITLVSGAASLLRRSPKA